MKKLKPYWNTNMLCVYSFYSFLSFPFYFLSEMQSTDATVPVNLPPSPPPIMPSFLRREINDSKWWAGVSVLEANPHESECWVADHYSGYKYILSRGEKKGEYVKNTYYKNTYVEGSEYVLQSQCPFIVKPVDENDSADAATDAAITTDSAPASPAVVEKSSRLADPEHAKAAYIEYCKAMLAGVDKTQ
jgi:hypothetical protein